MKKYLMIPLILGAMLLSGCTQGGGGPNGPVDNLGGGGTVSEAPAVSESDNSKQAGEAAGEIPSGGEISSGAKTISGKTTLSEAGEYVVSGESSGKITVEAEGVTLWLDHAVLTNDKKVIEAAGDLTISLIGENTLSNTNPDGSNAIDCGGVLTVNGTGSLKVTSTKNGISANAVAVKDATLVIDAAKDGLHAEIDYKTETAAPEVDYQAGGYVVLDGATLTAVTKDDGIQADTFVVVKEGSAVDITTNGGAPQTITELSSDSGDGKGIKVGPIDWGEDTETYDENTHEIASDEYYIGIEGGTVTVNANDDAIHSDGEIAVSGGTIAIAAGDDALHAEELLTVSGGEISVERCYEGLEAAKVEIGGGTIAVTSADDGINAADGTTQYGENSNPNCHIIISGGRITVDAEGDGVDSNGTMLMTAGTLFVYGPTREGNAALDTNGGFLMNGGYLFAVGPYGMVEAPAVNSEQYVVSFVQNTSIAAGANLSLTDGDGKAIFSMTALKQCRSVIISCPELTAGGSYKIYGGDSELCSFTVNSRITSVGSSGGMGTPGGTPPGGFGGPGGPGSRPGGRG